MLASIKETEIHWVVPIRIKFGFMGLEEEHASRIIRALIRDSWPKIKYSKQCIYFIRLTGDVVPSYPDGTSPTVYIGEGDARARLLGHTKWLSPLITSVPGLGLEVIIAEVVRPNNTTLYQFVEADLIAWFAKKYGSIPWFNRQREKSKEGTYDYEPETEKALKAKLHPGPGNSFNWAIQPTKTNDFFTRWNKKGIKAEV